MIIRLVELAELGLKSSLQSNPLAKHGLLLIKGLLDLYFLLVFAGFRVWRGVLQVETLHITLS